MTYYTAVGPIFCRRDAILCSSGLHFSDTPCLTSPPRQRKRISTHVGRRTRVLSGIHRGTHYFRPLNRRVFLRGLEIILVISGVYLSLAPNGTCIPFFGCIFRCTLSRAAEEEETNCAYVWIYTCCRSCINSIVVWTVGLFWWRLLEQQRSFLSTSATLLTWLVCMCSL